MRLFWHGVTIFLTVLSLSACTAFFGARPDVNLLGDPAAISEATRKIVIYPNTQYVNVTDGEIIRFIVGNGSFAWNFTFSHEGAPFDLRQIAPAGMLDREVTIYVAPNPSYSDDRWSWWAPWPSMR